MSTGNSLRPLSSSSMPGASGTILEQLVEAVAVRAAALVLEQLEQTSSGGRWLTGAKAAAEYIGCSPRRIYNRLPEIPHVRDGGRLLFDTTELDEWLRGS